MVCRFEHGFVHFFGVESTVPDPQLCSWKNVLKPRAAEKYRRGEVTSGSHWNVGHFHVCVQE